MRRLKAQAFEGSRSRPAGHGVAPTLLALALGFQGAAAWANCTTSGSNTTCTAAGGAHRAKVGGGSTGNNQHVTVQAGARIEAGDSGAISVGNNSRVQIQDGAVVQSTVNTAASGQYAKTLEAASNNNISIQVGAQLLAKGSASQSSALGLSGAGNTVTNHGTIRADNAAAIWITANTANAANTIDNYGTIETVLNGGYANAIGSTRNNSATGAGVTVRNHANGRIVGNVKFEAGDDSVILDGGSTITGSLNGGSGNNSLTLKAGDGTLGRAIRNFGTITKQEAGTWTLNGQVGRNDNNFKSTVKVEGGTLVLRGDNSGATQGGVLQVSAGATADVTAASAMQSISNAGTVQFTQDSNAAYAGVLSGTGSIVKRGGGDLTLTGNNTHTGKVVVEAGSLSVSAANNLGGAGSSVQLKGGALALKKTIAVNRGLTLDSGAQTLIIEPGTTTTWQGQVSGAGKLVTQGGTLVLEHASNTYSGGTEINNGTLRAAHDASLGSGTLALKNSQLAATDSFTATRALTLAGNESIDVAATKILSWNGEISGAGTLVKEGQGTLLLRGTNQQNGGTTVNAGTLQISRDANLGRGALALNDGTLQSTGSFATSRAATLRGQATMEVDASHTVTWNGELSGGGMLRKSGQGTLALAGANTYSGGTVVEAGALRAGHEDNLGRGAITLQGGDLLAGGSFSSNRDLTLVRGSLDVARDATLTWNGAISGAGDLVKTGDGTLALTGVNEYAGQTVLRQGKLRVAREESLGGAALVLENNTVFESAGSYAIGRRVTLKGAPKVATPAGDTLEWRGTVDGDGKLYKQGGGTLVLSGNNTYAKGVEVWGGVVQVSRDQNLGAANGAVTLNGGGLAANGDFTSNRQLELTAGAKAIDVAAGKDVTWRGVVNGAGALTKAGDGTLRLESVNTYTGGTRLQGGTVQVSRDNNLGQAAGAVTFDGGRLASTGSFATARAATLNNAGQIDTAQGTTLTWNGAIGGKGELRKQGAGTLVLGGANTYQGDTRVEAGTLQVSADANLGQGAVHLHDSRLATTGTFATSRRLELTGRGTVQAAAAATLDWRGTVAGAGTLVKEGAGTLVLAGDNQHAGGTLVHGGTLRIARDANLGAAGTAVTLDGGTLATTASLALDRALRVGARNGVLLPDAGTTLDWRGVVAGAGKLTKAGPGMLVLSADNRHGGGTAVTGGTLQVSRDANLGAAAGALTLDGGTLLSTASFASARAATLDAAGGTFVTRDGTRLDWDGAIGGAGGLVKEGAGELRLGNANTYQGPTRIAAGRLAVNGSIASPVTVEQAGVLGGTGRIVGDVANRGVVAPGNSIGALTVAGNYAGTGGSLEVEAVLGGDAAPADRLVLDGGAASGVTPVVVKPQGGVGGLTLRGIPVVVAQGGATTAPGAFRLAQPLVAGAYEYQLLRGAGDGAAAQAQDWYLRTSRVERDKAGRIVKVVPFYRPEVALYAGTPMLMRMTGTEMLGSYRERAGQTGAVSPEAGATAARGGWARTFGRRFERSAGGEAAPSFDGHLAGAQLGADLYARSSGTRHTDAFGVFGGYATVRGDVHGLARGEIQAVGTSTLRATQLGAYWTHTGPGGWYIDTVLAGTRYRQQTKSSAQVGAVSRGWGMTASVEAGYPWQLNPRWRIEPQAQVVYQQLGIANGADRVSTVSYKTPDALTARLGTRLSGQYAYGKAQLRPFMGVSLLHDFTGADTVTFAGAHGVRASRQNTAVDLKAGVDTQLGKSVGLWGQVGYGKSVGSGDGSDRGWSANLGLRVAY
ncbi:autotransporter BatB [Bordetella parapertussis]|uniref:Autotransporter n=2 Tax=Bordetella parapertussis TaxID=519 RepID=Q7WC76_BORPA|nr:autotransporter BatB [Bordetella parapertussis]AZW24949.1 autotransporter BatB [Bordetella parapertussis]AZW34081.1 autotransporter BatB [Bordetella parapertussis]AZW38247.1 autotransporter BatB [Bordetella parapertussis]AZW47092.1 autotransporter BatB [Bordetella parapertussis]AZW51256.1 autotransporter BatB [Bordetella parapertussis]